MYAVIESGGKQYRVSVGDVIRVEKRPEAEGASIALDQVLLVADEDNVQVGTPRLNIEVTATVRGHGRHDKIRIFKMRRRKHYRKHAGHRQYYTDLEIMAIGGAGKAASAAGE